MGCDAHESKLQVGVAQRACLVKEAKGKHFTLDDGNIWRQLLFADSRWRHHPKLPKSGTWDYSLFEAESPNWYGLRALVLVTSVEVLIFGGARIRGSLTFESFETMSDVQRATLRKEIPLCCLLLAVSTMQSH